MDAAISEYSATLCGGACLTTLSTMYVPLPSVTTLTDEGIGLDRCKFDPVQQTFSIEAGDFKRPRRPVNYGRVALQQEAHCGASCYEETVTFLSALHLDIL